MSVLTFSDIPPLVKVRYLFKNVLFTDLPRPNYGEIYIHTEGTVKSLIFDACSGSLFEFAVQNGHILHTDYII